MPRAAAVIERGSGGIPGVMLRSPKARGRRNVRKTIEMPIIITVKGAAKSTNRSKPPGRGGRGNGKTKDKDQDHADTSLSVCGQQPLLPALSPTSLPCLLQGGQAEQTLDKDIGWDRDAGLVSGQRLGSAVIFSLC